MWHCLTSNCALTKTSNCIFLQVLCFLQALYLAEQKAREAVETRARIQHELLNNQKERKEDELRKIAQQARMDRVGGNPVVVPLEHDHGRESQEIRIKTNYGRFFFSLGLYTFF